MVEGREVVEVEEEEAAYGDELHDGCGERTEGDLAACTVVDKVAEEPVPMTGCVNAVYYGSCKEEGMAVEVVGMEEGMGEDKVVGTVGVGVGDSTAVGMKVRRRLLSMDHISWILDCFWLKKDKEKGMLFRSFFSYFKFSYTQLPAKFSPVALFTLTGSLDRWFKVDYVWPEFFLGAL